MTVKELEERMDEEEIDLQMAYDLVDADEQRARRLGVKTPAELRATRGIGARDPDWFRKLSKLYGFEAPSP
jgi:hypothetical protein